jgi:catechol 2,3-dioxygenase-like lactoylglutathione lyase family enzyme
MIDYIIHGIQHLGVGVPNHATSWKWYRKYFGLDVPLFNAEADSHLMTPYTRGDVITKKAAMVLNLKGGCAMEIVCPTSFQASHAAVQHQLGDLGIFIGWIKTPDVKGVYNFYKNSDVRLITRIVTMPNGWDTFFLKDLNGLLFQVIPDAEVYSKSPHITGGTAGCVIGVSDMERARIFYQILGYDQVNYDETGVFSDWSSINGGSGRFRRVLLSQQNPSGGGFSKLIGKSHIELVQDLSERKPVKIYEDRMWGDTGFIHLGFDVRNMGALGEKLSDAGHGFTCDTKDVLSMGESTRVHCTYTEDPDGTLIEMVEVYKIPIIEKLGIYLNVEKRKPSQPLPDLMLKALKFVRVKD